MAESAEFVFALGDLISHYEKLVNHLKDTHNGFVFKPKRKNDLEVVQKVLYELRNQISKKLSKEEIIFC